MPVGPKRRGFPADPIIESQIRFYSPAVFPIESDVKVPQVESRGGTLREIGGSANQHVREIKSSLIAVKRESAVALVVHLSYWNVIPVVVRAEFNRVGTLDLGEVILQLVRLGLLNPYHHILT